MAFIHRFSRLVTLQFQRWLHVCLNRQDTCMVIEDGFGVRRLQTMALGFRQIQTMILVFRRLWTMVLVFRQIQTMVLLFRQLQTVTDDGFWAARVTDDGFGDIYPFLYLF